ncbi:DUF5820 family protein [Halogranum rubrum]|nr:DUF5820 family protein [Halogranum salarium]
MSFDALPEGWVVWNDEPEGRAIVAYRPDVFNTEDFPPPCMPTIFVSNGSRSKRPGASQIPTDTWHITLFLEPDIEAVTETFDSRPAAVDGAIAAAERFVDGEVDYRDVYQVPREEYFDKLDELLGRDDGND